MVGATSLIFLYHCMLSIFATFTKPQNRRFQSLWYQLCHSLNYEVDEKHDKRINGTVLILRGDDLVHNPTLQETDMTDEIK